jgi:hypothetical protein
MRKANPNGLTSYEAVEGGCVSPHWPGKFVGALGPLREVVSQTKFCCNVNNIRDAICRCHLD